MNYKLLVFLLLAGCKTLYHDKPGQVYYALAPTLTGEMKFKACKSFVVNDVLYHSSGDIFPLQDLVFIGQTPGQFALEADVYEAPNGVQIYRTALYIEVSSLNYLETLVREDKLEDVKKRP